MDRRRRASTTCRRTTCIGVQPSTAATSRCYSVDGVVYATDNICTHGHARLCDGFLEGHEIECPLHQGRFDVRNGRALCAPATEAIRVYPVKVEAGRVLLDLG